MIKNLLSPGQALRRIASKEVARVHSFYGQDYFFQDLLLDGISDIVLSSNEKKNIFIMGVDKEEDLLNHLNSNSLFAQQAVVVVRNAKKIKSKFHAELIDYCKNPSSDNILVFIFDDPYSTNKFIDEISTTSTCVDMRTPFPNKIKEWAKYYSKKKKLDLSENIINQLVENYGENVSSVANEIEKLYLFSSGQTESINKIIDSNIYKKENQVWKLLD